MKLILIQDTLDKGYTGFLNDHPLIVFECDTPEQATEKVKQVANVFLKLALDEGNIEVGKLMIEIKDMNNFEIVVYTIEGQYKLLKEKIKV